MQHFINLYLLICSFLGTVYGSKLCLKVKMPLYFQMVCVGVASLMLSKLYSLVIALCFGGYPETFHAGLLGENACFLFLLLANYGEMDSLIDDGSKELKKYRIRALCVNILYLFVFGLILIGSVDVGLKAEYCMICILAGGTSYYSLKHIIIPDVSGGIIGSIRAYNVLVCGMSLFMNLYILSSIYEFFVLKTISAILLGFVVLVMIPVLEKRIRSWSI